MYLAALYQEGLRGRAIRERLHLLDLDRRIRGLCPWHQDPDVRTFLRGVFSDRPVGERRSHYEPLYLELVHAMVDATRAPTDDQRRRLAASLLRQRLGLSNAAICRARWADISLGKHRVEIAVTSRVGRGPVQTRVYPLHATPGRPDCPAAAIRALRPLGGGEYLLGVEGRPFDANALTRLLAAADTSAMAPGQVRDAALLLLGYGAGLRTSEARLLRQRDIKRQDRGLVMEITGRRRLTFLPSAPDPAYDSSKAWDAWLTTLDVRGFAHPDRPAFLPTTSSAIFDKPMHQSGLNRVVHLRAEEAGLVGRFAWTSLRTGMMRTALRNEAPPHAIAAHADLVSMGSVQRHERRENLLGEGNVAGRLGL